MKKIRKTTLLSYAISLLVAANTLASCSQTSKHDAPQSEYPAPSVLPNKEEIFPPDGLEKGENRVPAPTQTDVWNVSDVDLSHINFERKHIAFTFDDSPNRTLEQIVGVFTEFNQSNPDCIASATVFYNGVGFNEYALPAAQAAYAVGFETGNHTYSHFNLCEIDHQTLQWEIDEVDKILKNIDGKATHLLRAPYGKIDQTVRDTAKTPLVDWSVDTLDWTGISAEEICERVYTGLEDGGIVLMHDGPKNTVEALKTLLPQLKSRGYQVTGVSQLSKINACPLKRGGAYTRIRKK